VEFILIPLNTIQNSNFHQMGRLTFCQAGQAVASSLSMTYPFAGITHRIWAYFIFTFQFYNLYTQFLGRSYPDLSYLVFTFVKTVTTFRGSTTTGGNFLLKLSKYVDTFNGDEDSRRGLLDSDALYWCGSTATFRRTFPPPSSRWKVAILLRNYTVSKPRRQRFK